MARHKSLSVSALIARPADWSAIRIIALSQSNPLNAIAEFVGNSIDAQARIIAITRTHICGSFKKGAANPRAVAPGCRGSSAFDLPSFWTLGGIRTLSGGRHAADGEIFLFNRLKLKKPDLKEGIWRFLS